MNLLYPAEKIMIVFSKCLINGKIDFNDTIEQKISRTSSFKSGVSNLEAYSGLNFKLIQCLFAYKKHRLTQDSVT